MSCQVRIPIDPKQHRSVTTRWQDLVDQAKGYGIELERNGEFNGAAKGQVYIGHNEILIDVTHKPMLVPAFMIESKLRGMLHEFFAKG